MLYINKRLQDKPISHVKKYRLIHISLKINKEVRDITIALTNINNIIFYIDKHKK